jgi:CheY-like chemotaxis protein
VLINLLGNAVKFTHAGQVRLDVSCCSGSDECQFTITDTGIGIRPDDLEKLFEPFVQAEQSSNRNYGGTGLGLTISRQLVALMGGCLEARSEPGVGSRFSFSIALPPADAPAVAQRQPRTNDLIGRRLLIADPSAQVCQVLAEHARYWGMIVTTADATDSTRHIARSPSATVFDVITIDSRLCEDPEMSAALRRLTSAPGTPFTVLLSADPAEADRIARSTGITEVLPKPVGPSTYYNCLTELFQPHSSRPEARGRHVVTGGDAPVRGRVLVAEDNEINQLVAEDLLAAMGYRIDIAHNGEEALELAAANDYVAVLMDCQMPEVDGYEATRRLRRAETGTAHLPIIAMTAGAMASDRQRCLDAGMDDCVTKPVDPDNLERILIRWTADAPLGDPRPTRTSP